jgi:hypothetical protein
MMNSAALCDKESEKDFQNQLNCLPVPAFGAIGDNVGQ